MPNSIKVTNLNDYLFQRKKYSSRYSLENESFLHNLRNYKISPDFSLPSIVIEQKSMCWGIPFESIEFAKKLDEEDPLAHFQHLFCIPMKKNVDQVDLCQVNGNENCIYLCGHSLGLKPKSADQYVHSVLENWGKRGVYCHFSGSIQAAFCDLPSKAPMAKIVGALPDEVAIMNGLSVNLHILLATFYRPNRHRCKILIEEYAFSSDIHVVTSHLNLHGYDPDTCMITIKPRMNEHLIHEDDIITLIEKEGDSIAVMLLPAVQYYTGQFLNIERLTVIAHNKGIIVGLDAAHAVGNVPLYLHDWGIDFAVWCTYKYLNSGPGCLGGIFVHQNHTQNGSSSLFPILKGWWGNNQKTRFLMKKEFDPSFGADMFRISNPPPLLAAPLMASLDIFSKVSMKDIWKKQFLLTGYLELLLNHYFSTEVVKNIIPTYGFDKTFPTVQIITPTDPTRRGSQLSLIFSIPLTLVQKELQKRGVVCDIRFPNVMRVAPTPLYNSFMHVYLFVDTLRSILNSLNNQWTSSEEETNEEVFILSDDCSKISSDLDDAF